MTGVVIGQSRLHVPASYIEPSSRPGYGEPAPTLCGLMRGGVYVLELAPPLPCCRFCRALGNETVVAAIEEHSAVPA